MLTMERKSEKEILIGYLGSPPLVQCYSKTALGQYLIDNFFYSLVDNHEHGVDIYSVDNKRNEGVIIEHFQFDASKEKSNKGMQGISLENKLLEKQKTFFTPTNPEPESIESISYKETTEDYLKNISKVFMSHYNSIPAYKKSLMDNGIINKTSKIYMGFFIENRKPPIYYSKDHKITEVMLLDTKQFLDIFEHSLELDFILFGGFFEQKERLFYLDRKNFTDYQKEQIDLSNIQLLSSDECVITYKGVF